MAKETMKDKLDMMDAKIEHIEDINADNRALIVKLVKQNNEIITFLKSLEIEPVGEEMYYSAEENKQSLKLEKLKALLDEFKEKNKDLKEFEEEMEKHKDKLTPGQMGES